MSNREVREAKKKAEREKRKAERPCPPLAQRIADMQGALDGYKARIEVFMATAEVFGRRCGDVPGVTFPERWSLDELQSLSTVLRSSGSVDHADRVQSYAESRRQVERLTTKTMRLRQVQAKLIERARSEAKAASPAPTPVTERRPLPPSRADESPFRLTGRRAKEARPGWSTDKWVGRGVIPDNPPAWHATVPPWEDGPETSPRGEVFSPSPRRPSSPPSASDGG